MKLLVIRFSAMGDVALTVPVIRGVLEANPELDITMVSNATFEPFFNGIDRFKFYGIKLKEYSGVIGLRRLYKELDRIDKWDAIVDLHSVMRSWVVGGFFKLAGTKVCRIDKGREEKAELVNKEGKKLVLLKHTTERYLEVFKSFGLDGQSSSGPVLVPTDSSKLNLQNFLKANGINKEGKWIGIAPFSVHRQKTWPRAKIESLIARLANDESTRIFLFGSPAESASLKEMTAEFRNCQIMAGVLSLEEEIALMYELDVMIAMDSFNMHLAALCNTKVVSIWGGTHYFAGFGPLNDNLKNIVEIDPKELTCRPCSVFGSKTCYRGDWACLEQIEVDTVISKL